MPRLYAGGCMYTGGALRSAVHHVLAPGKPPRKMTIDPCVHCVEYEMPGEGGGGHRGHRKEGNATAATAFVLCCEEAPLFAARLFFLQRIFLACVGGVACLGGGCNPRVDRG